MGGPAPDLSVFFPLRSATTIPAMNLTLKEKAEASSPGLVVTALGPDRPGLVNRLAAFIGRAGGNIEDTRMVKLGGEFAVLVYVTGTQTALDALVADRPHIEREIGLTLFTKTTRKDALPRKGLAYVLEVSALDRPGIVESVSDVLARFEVNVASLSSKVVYAPLSGTPMFQLEAELEIPPEVNIKELRRAIDDAAERENLDLTLAPARS